MTKYLVAFLMVFGSVAYAADLNLLRCNTGERKVGELTEVSHEIKVKRSGPNQYQVEVYLNVDAPAPNGYHNFEGRGMMTAEGVQLEFLNTWNTPAQWEPLLMGNLPSLVAFGGYVYGCPEAR